MAQAASSPQIHVPGYTGSGPAHWQSLWEADDPAIRRLAPDSWDRPRLDDWIGALDRAVAEAAAQLGGPPVLVAHSLGCLLVAHWQAVRTAPVRAALLVAVPDPDGPNFPAEAASFRNPPQGPLRFPSRAVASTDDPYAAMDYSRAQAGAWNCDLAVIGAAGHINGDSALGRWPEGKALLDDLRARA